MSAENLKRLRRFSRLDEDPVTRIAVSKPTGVGHASVGSNAAMGKSITSTIAQQEKEFQKAIQPGSPISALLSSARQPLVMGTNADREAPLLRKLQAAAKESPLRRKGVKVLPNIMEEDVALREKGDEETRKKELEAQKARIVAQMAPVREEGMTELPGARERECDQENVPPAKRLREKERAREVMTEELGTCLLFIGINISLDPSSNRCWNSSENKCI